MSLRIGYVYYLSWAMPETKPGPGFDHASFIEHSMALACRDEKVALGAATSLRKSRALISEDDGEVLAFELPTPINITNGMPR
jgi:hypothetical protein